MIKIVDALERGRSAVLFIFVLRKFLVKIKSFTGGYFSETVQKTIAIM